ncbi:MAG: hypothetical protein HKN77_07570 [Woeseiaceae bacterium]|nr:hypothetical protein [Woeseiaceae bacterium]
MNYSGSNFSPRRGFPAGNPIANALVIIVGALVIGASIVLGFFAFVLLASVLIVFSAFVGLRLWWFNRKMTRHNKEATKRPRPRPDGVIEGEFKVVAKDRIDRDQP